MLCLVAVVDGIRCSDDPGPADDRSGRVLPRPFWFSRPAGGLGWETEPSWSSLARWHMRLWIPPQMVPSHTA